MGGPLSVRAKRAPLRVSTTLVYVAQCRICALETLVRVAGTRWCIESRFEDTEQGGDEYEVHSTAG